jgi:hypothetical protein
MEKETFKAAVDLIRRLPPSKIKNNTNALIGLMPNYAEELLQKIDKPLGIFLTLIIFSPLPIANHNLLIKY